MIGFRSFEIVDVIARSGTLTRAADLLEMSQPALTKALSTIERRMDLKLFERRANGMEPTQFAHVLIRRWQGIHRDLREMRHEIDRIRGVDEGVLRIATGYLGASSAELALGSLMRRFPALRIESRQAVWSDVVDAVRRGDADIGISDPSDAEHDPDLKVEFLIDRPAHFICRVGHPILEMYEPDITDILSYPFVINLIPKRMGQHFPDDIEIYGLKRTVAGHVIPPTVVQSVSAIRNILMMSDGISLIPVGSFGGIFPADQFARIENFTPPWLFTRLGFMTRVRSTVTPAMTAFIEEVRRIELDDRRSILSE